MVFGENIIDCYDLFHNPLPSIEHLVGELVQKQGLNYLVGLPETFKTSFSLMIAINGAIGKDVLRFKTIQPFNTLFIDEENGLVGTKMKFKQLVKGLGADINDLKGKIHFSCIEGFRIDKTYINTLKLLIKKYQPQLIVIDNIARCLVGDENDVGSVSMIPRLLKPLQEEFEVAFLIIHHKRKGFGNDMESTRGSGDFGGQCDVMNILDVVNTNNGVRKFKLSQGKRKYALPIEPINFTVQGDSESLKVEYVGTMEENIETVVKRIEGDIIKWMQENPNEFYKTTEIINEMKELGYHETSTRKALKNLAENHVLKKMHGQYSIVGGSK